MQVQEAGGGDAESLQQNHHQAAEHLQNGRGAGQQRRAPVPLIQTTSNALDPRDSHETDSCVCVCVSSCSALVMLLTAGPEADGLHPGAAGSAGERDATRPWSVCQRESSTAGGTHSSPVLHPFTVTKPLHESSICPVSHLYQACRIRDPLIPANEAAVFSPHYSLEAV